MTPALILLTLGIQGANSQLLTEPTWMSRQTADAVTFPMTSYTDAVYRIPALAKDLNGVAVGHAIAYEDLVTGRASTLETKTFDRIDRILKSPPRWMPDEASLSPTFVRTYQYLEKVFDWSHMLHAQTIDVLADPRLNDSQKDQEITQLWRVYKTKAPFTITGLPMNMEVLDSLPTSANFRKTYPKVNGLFWGYHWLQTSVYDLLWHTPPTSHVAQYSVTGARYREVELYRTDRDFMPMMAETSPRFSKAFPEIANSFDNLHMLHDMVNDVLATPTLTRAQKEQEIRQSIVKVLGSTHLNAIAGEGEPGTLMDHRFPAGMPGMGMMKGGDEEAMFMSGMGWMSMEDCAHCSIRMPESNPWGATVSAEGWTMQVRCLMCARDMASETPGRAIIRASTNDPTVTLVLISDEEGNWTSSLPNVLFLESPATDAASDHPECAGWSRAFVSRAAFDEYVKANEMSNAKPLDLKSWAALNGGKPQTYRKINKPNPYQGGGK